MKAIRILIVEDENLIAQRLSLALEELGFKTVAILARGEDAIELVQENASIDLIVMDIELQGKLNGIETIKKIHSIESIPVIILSGKTSEAYINEASEAAIYAFLPKPFNALAIKVSIEIALNLFNNEVASNERFKGNIKIASKDKIFIKQGRQYFKINKEDILYVKADRNNCLLYTTDDNKYVYTMSMAKFQEKFHYLNLFKIHKSHLINIDKVATFSTDDGKHNCELTPNGKINKLEQTEKTILPISRTRWIAFQNAIRV